MALTDTSIKNTKPKEKKYRVRDSDKLFLEIYPNGIKGWRIRYRRNGKEREVCLGNYPALPLKEARKQRDEFNETLTAGLDPVEEKNREKLAITVTIRTFRDVSEKWLEDRAAIWTADHLGNQIARVRRSLLPALGDLQLSEITPASVLALLKDLEKQGFNNAAHRVLGVISQIMRYAVANGWASSDPCRDLRGALAPVMTNHHPAIIDPLAIGKLLLDIDNYQGTGVVMCALRLAPLVFVRPSELRRAEWREFNFAEKEWRIPAARMKMKDPHIVPLCRQAMIILTELRAMTGEQKFVFPSMRTRARNMSSGTILAALRQMGYSNDEMTGHGFRTMASTMLNEHGKNADHIERQLAHSPRNQVRAAYNRAQYLEERREMMQWWGDYLDELRAKRREYEQNRRQNS